MLLIKTFFYPIAIFFTLLLLIKLFKPKKSQKHIAESKPSAHFITSSDIAMVAGDDVITTQLDLARAYLEMGKKNLAKSILLHVKKNGKPEQQREARRLISSI